MHAFRSYAQLEARDFPSHLGCRSIYMDPIDVTILAPVKLPRTSAELAKRKPLKAWLTRVFLCTLVNGRQLNPFTRILCPNTLVAFVHLLIHLHSVGYPGHWLSNFLNTLLTNTLSTNIRPYTGALPISPRHDWTQGRAIAHVHLDPWIPEMESIVATILPALPFALPLPPQFPAPGDIILFKAGVFCFENECRYSPVSALLLFNLAKVRLAGASNWPRHIATVLQGEGPCKPTDICVLLSVEALVWDPAGEVRWRMSRARVERMKEQGWAVVVYGTHNETISSSVAPAKSWTEIV
ncbi:hypothetical protein C8R43DRAFT_1137130 [Mycena crocata]|nr:hypothetical protein C8R43DRAFT_1137130 [Mycena crocata]